MSTPQQQCMTRIYPLRFDDFFSWVSKLDNLLPSQLRNIWSSVDDSLLKWWVGWEPIARRRSVATICRRSRRISCFVRCNTVKGQLSTVVRFILGLTTIHSRASIVTSPRHSIWKWELLALVWHRSGSRARTAWRTLRQTANTRRWKSTKLI